MLIRGDARRIPLRDGCVQCVVTSPPYWGLRDYGAAGQIGLEARPSDYVSALVAVFREVRRVLGPSGTCWLNLGDSYVSNGNYSEAYETSRDRTAPSARSFEKYAAVDPRPAARAMGLKVKDLVGIPWRVAFALQADGWYLRSDIVWSKPNPMPESVTDRPTKAHEYLFLLTKSARYFYDAEAICERVSESGVIAGADGDGEGLVFGQDFRFQDAGAADPSVSVRLATAILDFAERQHDPGLLALDTEVGQQRTDRLARLPVVHVPIVRRATTQAASFTDGDISAEEFLQEMDRLCVALPDGDDLKEAWRFAAFHVGHVHADSDRSVAVHDASEVGQFEGVHASDTTARVPSLHRKNEQSGDHRKVGFNDRWDAKEAARKSGGNFSRAYAEAQPNHGAMALERPHYLTRNKRSVWTVPTQPYAGAHFATFPEALIEPCILAGSRPGDLVLDPFIGSGTTGAVCDRLMRRWVGLDLSYQDLAKARTRQAGLRLSEATA